METLNNDVTSQDPMELLIAEEESSVPSPDDFALAPVEAKVVNKRKGPTFISQDAYEKHLKAEEKRKSENMLDKLASSIGLNTVVYNGKVVTDEDGMARYRRAGKSAFKGPHSLSNLCDSEGAPLSEEQGKKVMAGYKMAVTNMIMSAAKYYEAHENEPVIYKGRRILVRRLDELSADDDPFVIYNAFMETYRQSNFIDNARSDFTIRNAKKGVVSADAKVKVTTKKSRKVRLEEMTDDEVEALATREAMKEAARAKKAAHPWRSKSTIEKKPEGYDALDSGNVVSLSDINFL